jgi:hypothetical protein
MDDITGTLNALKRISRTDQSVITFNELNLKTLQQIDIARFNHDPE